ncbi:MAG: ABC transporter permease [Acidobacteria bacterium]|nr:ABC transporter permease [Acidobacteriota bacterium]
MERETDIVEELGLELEDAYDEAVRRGLPPEAALAEALGRVPSWEALAAELRSAVEPVLSHVPAPVRAALREPEPEGRLRAWAAGWHRDLALSVRALRSRPGFSVAVALTLGLGMGVSTALFCIVNALLLRPLPLERIDELVNVYCVEKGLVTHVPMAYPDYRDVREARRGFQDLAAYALRPLALESGDEKCIVIGEMVTPNYFDVLGVTPVLGRRFASGEGEEPGFAAVAVLSYGAWERLFGRDPAVLGRSLRLNGRTFAVVGVAPRSFQGLLRGLSPEVFIPFGAYGLFGSEEDPGVVRRDRLENRGSRYLSVVGRLAPGATVESVRAEVVAAGARLEAAYPQTNTGRRFDALPTASVRVIPGVDGILFAVSGGLLAVSGLVVLIACANAAGMLLARGAARRREIAVRYAMGASRSRVVRLLLTEGLLLSVLGAAVGLAFALVSNRLLSSVQLPFPVRLDLGLRIDLGVVLWASLLSAVSTIGFALLPALRATQLDPGRVLKEDALAISPRGRLGSALVVFQIALSVVLLAGASLLLRSLLGAHRVDPGFTTHGIALLETDPSLRGYSPAAIEAFYERLEKTARALPGVEATAYTSHLPLAFEIRTTDLAVDGEEPVDKRLWPEVDTAVVGPGYFNVLGIPLLSGRDFAPGDRAGASPVTIVNEAFEKRFFPGGNALGRLVKVGDAKAAPSRIVGIVKDAKYRTLGEEPRPFLYQTLRGSGEDSWTLLVKTPTDAALLPALRQTLADVDDQVPIRALRTMTEATSASLLLPRAGLVLFGVVGVLGLALAAVGLYGLVAQLAVQRTHEIGIRIALGASGRDIFGLVISQGLKLGLIGISLGLAGALAVAPALSAFLYGIAPRDPATFVAVPLVLLAVTLLAGTLPALRSARLSPQGLLRRE